MAQCECPHCGNRQEFDETGGRPYGVAGRKYRAIEVECDSCGEQIEMNVEESSNIEYR